jgi:RNA polymerase sigma-70 factor (ECF subfamily)
MRRDRNPHAEETPVSEKRKSRRSLESACCSETVPTPSLDRIIENEVAFAPAGSLAGTEDIVLVAAAKSGSSHAFEVLVERHGRRVRRVAQRVIGNREDAEDIVQQSFLKAFVHLQKFEGRSSFSTWLTRIAINQSLMKLRTRRSRELQLDSPAATEDTHFCAEVAGDAPTPDQLCWQEELRRLLASAMSKIPVPFREVLHLRAIEERSIEETASMLGLPIGTVKFRTHRGRRKLREVLTKYFRPSELANFSATDFVRGRL